MLKNILITLFPQQARILGHLKQRIQIPDWKIRTCYQLTPEKKVQSHDWVVCPRVGLDLFRQVPAYKCLLCNMPIYSPWSWVAMYLASRRLVKTSIQYLPKPKYGVTFYSHLIARGPCVNPTSQNSDDRYYVSLNILRKIRLRTLVEYIKRRRKYPFLIRRRWSSPDVGVRELLWAIARKAAAEDYLKSLQESDGSGPMIKTYKKSSAFWKHGKHKGVQNISLEGNKQKTKKPIEKMYGSVRELMDKRGK